MTTSTYQYQPLSGPRRTRLVILRPADNRRRSGGPRCELVEIDVDDAPDYFALSYTWNGETPSVPLAIRQSRDVAATSRLLITPNCAAALRALCNSWHRGVLEPRKIRIWIDAICINQASNAEKSAQVEMMADIYRKAAKVVVWLGNDAPANARKLSGVVVFNTLRRLRAILFESHDETKPNRWRDKMVGLAYKVCDHDTLRKLLVSEYWIRIWTLQEFSNSNVFVLCQSSQLLPFLELLVVMLRHQFQYYVYPAHLRFWGFRNHIYVFGDYHGREVNDGKTLMVITNMDILRELRLMKASEPRDKIFALRALHGNLLSDIVVDYNKPVGKVFAQASRLLIEKMGNLDLLYHAALPRTVGSLEDTAIPSWAVDFGADDLPDAFVGVYDYEGYEAYSASAWSKPVISFPDDRRQLLTRGKMVCRVGGLISDAFPLDYASLCQREGRGGCVGGDGKSGSGQEPPTLPPRKCCYPDLDVLYRFSLEKTPAGVESEADGGVGGSSHATVSRGLYEFLQSIYFMTTCYGSRVRQLRRGGHTEMRSLIPTLMTAPEYGTFSREYRQMLLGGRLFCATGGIFGLGSPNVLEGDEVWLVAGMSRAFAFRRRPGGDGCRVVGPVMIQDARAMAGELWPEDEDELEDIVIV